MSPQIIEERSVRVRSDDSVFSFVAAPDRGYPEIREHPMAKLGLRDAEAA